MKYLSLNIKNLKDRENLSEEDFGKKFGLNRGAIQSYIADKAKPKIETLQKISEMYNISIDDLLNRDINEPNDVIELNESIPTYGREVPFWNLPVTAGRSIRDVIGASKPDGFISGLPGVDITENILPVTGTSMEPEINPGALIGVRLINNWETLNTERIYLIITSDDRMIKRIEHDVENEDILWCVSPNYPRFKIYKSDIIEIQRVCFVYNPK